VLEGVIQIKICRGGSAACVPSCPRAPDLGEQVSRHTEVRPPVSPCTRTNLARLGPDATLEGPSKGLENGCGGRRADVWSLVRTCFARPPSRRTTWATFQPLCRSPRRTQRRQAETSSRRQIGAWTFGRVGDICGRGTSRCPCLQSAAGALTGDLRLRAVEREASRQSVWIARRAVDDRGARRLLDLEIDAREEDAGR
jgi:hypothetical protein